MYSSPISAIPPPPINIGSTKNISFPLKKEKEKKEIISVDYMASHKHETAHCSEKMWTKDVGIKVTKEHDS